MAKLKGCQTPSRSVYLTSQEKDKTKYLEAIKLYEASERTSQKWQSAMMKHILSQNKKGLWVHTKVGYSIPRRNGKSELLIMRVLWGLENGEKILYTAHRTTTSHAVWERLCKILDNAGYKCAASIRKGDEVPEELLYDSYKAYGLESIELRKSGAKINFRTRTSKGGLGEGYDLLIIDEAQEYQDDQESSLKYVVTDSQNPQTIMCGTPPTAVSTGTVFVKYRGDVLEGKVKNGAWAEWSVDEMTDPNDKDAWVKTNPSLGTVFTERSIEDEIGTDDVDFNIQRLGLWLSYNQASAIKETEWNELKLAVRPEITGKVFIGIKFGKNGKNIALSVAAKTKDDKIFTECLYCKPINSGIGWVVDLIKKIPHAEVVADGANGQKMLEDAAKEAHQKIKFMTVAEIINANAEFEQGIFQKKVSHFGQESLTMIATNCKKRNIGSNGGFGYESLMDDLEIAILDSAIYAYWACCKGKERKVQKVSY